MSALDGRRDGVLETSVREAVTDSNGFVIGWICGIWRGGFYQGSFFVQTKRIPAHTVGHCRDGGINASYAAGLMLGP